MSNEQPTMILALYDTLADAEATLNDLQAGGLDYAVIRMQAHDANAYADVRTRATSVSDHVWSLSVPTSAANSAVNDTLHKHNPLAVGQAPAPGDGRDEVAQGAVAWQHYRFDAAGTDQIADAAGTTGTTGVISSGVFADPKDGDATS